MIIVHTIVQAIWGCMPELANDCQDMTNSSSTYFSILIGAIIGAVISWWIYNRQMKTSKLQDATLEKIRELNERHDEMLKRIQQIEQHHQATLDGILKMEKRLADLVKRSD
jgi:gas vesicle protein